MKEYSIGCHFFIHSSCNDDTSRTAVPLAALLWIWRTLFLAVLLQSEQLLFVLSCIICTCVGSWWDSCWKSLWSDTGSMRVIHLHSLIFKLFSIPWNSHRLPRWCMSNLLRFVMNNFARVISTSIKFSHGFFLYCSLLSILQSLWISWPLLLLAIFIWVEIIGRFGGPLTS